MAIINLEYIDNLALILNKYLYACIKIRLEIVRYFILRVCGKLVELVGFDLYAN